MKSAIGIGSLLADGLGDTVRVSLTEDPWFELVPCQRLIEIASEAVNDQSKFDPIPEWTETIRDFQSFTKRKGVLPVQLEGDQFDIRGMMHRDGSVFSTVTMNDLKNPDLMYRNLGAKMVVGMPFKDIATSDSIYLPVVPAIDDKESRRAIKRLQDVAVGVLAPISELRAKPFPNSVAIIPLSELNSNSPPSLPEGAIRYGVKVTGIEPAGKYDILAALSRSDERFVVTICEVPSHVSRVHAARRVFQLLGERNCETPVVHSLVYENCKTKDDLILRSGSEAGALLVDGLGDGIMISATTSAASDFQVDLQMLTSTSFGLLQGSRMRSTKTDFVSCPSCGRTLFDLQEVTEQIKKKTGHLPGVAIAIMGCIVNGPGEMADADFGYVGGAPGKVDLYVGKTVVKRGIPNALACDALVELIKENGRWQDPPEKEDTDATTTQVKSDSIAV
jgi:(E)-4-hydroxy-3-methylbut-2-enyl-diphosphate synthase